MLRYLRELKESFIPASSRIPLDLTTKLTLDVRLENYRSWWILEQLSVSEENDNWMSKTVIDAFYLQVNTKDFTSS